MDAATIIGLVQSVTKKWSKQRRAEEREANARARRYEAMTRTRAETIKDVAWETMEAAYLKASSDGTLPALARQVMYAARGEIQRRTGRSLDDQYFTQTLLVDYMRDNPEETSDWDVVFDARGHFEEPHTGRIVPLGTLDVRDYLDKVTSQKDAEADLKFKLPEARRFPTFGPAHRFGAILFIEKEGFLPLFERVKLAERYDLAIMSTKGMSVTASRLLIDELSAENRRLPLLVLHDFDKSGFSIIGTLERDTRRYEFQNAVEVVDLGLRLADVKAFELEAEDVFYGKSDPRWNLRENGATQEEIVHLCQGWEPGHGYHGKRVELNAFTSGDLIRWIEQKLEKHGVKKVVPEDKILEAAFRRAIEIELLNKEIEKVREDVAQQAEGVRITRALRRRVERRLKAERALGWDEAVAEEAKLALAESRGEIDGRDQLGRGGASRKRKREA